MRLIMLGLPAAGKGTQARLLQDRFGVPHISTGEMFREAIKSGNDVGCEAKKYIDRGELVPDELAIEIVKRRLLMADCRDGYILDGFPRTVPQAKSLDRVIGEIGKPIDAVINIQISEDEAIRRIAQRRVCAQCGATYSGDQFKPGEPPRCKICGGLLVQRDDDNEETARNRLKVYLQQTHPLVDYYAEQGILLTVNGEQEIEAVFEECVKGLYQIGAVSRSSGVS